MTNPQFESLLHMPAGGKRQPRMSPKRMSAGRQMHPANPSMTSEGTNQLPSMGMSTERAQMNPDEMHMAEERGLATGHGADLPGHQTKTGAVHPNGHHMSSMKIHGGSPYSLGAPTAGSGSPTMHMADEEHYSSERSLNQDSGPSIKGRQTRTSAKRPPVAHHMGSMSTYPASPYSKGAPSARVRRILRHYAGGGLTRDTEHAMMTPGEVVLNERQQRGVRIHDPSKLRDDQIRKLSSVQHMEHGGVVKNLSGLSHTRISSGTAGMSHYDSGGVAGGEEEDLPPGVPHGAMGTMPGPKPKPTPAPKPHYEGGGVAGEHKWIKGSIRHPGRMKRAAKRAGMSTHAYMAKHAHSPGSLGAAAREGLRLSAMSKG